MASALCHEPMLAGSVQWVLSFVRRCVLGRGQARTTSTAASLSVHIVRPQPVFPGVGDQPPLQRQAQQAQQPQQGQRIQSEAEKSVPQEVEKSVPQRCSWRCCRRCGGGPGPRVAAGSATVPAATPTDSTDSRAKLTQRPQPHRHAIRSLSLYSPSANIYVRCPFIALAPLYINGNTYQSISI